MPDPDLKAGPLLTRFLQGKDLPCEGCNYNLRGVKTLFCPECGMVIPRPPHDQVAALDPLHHNLLWCPKCRYELHNIPPGESCPECGYKLTREVKARRTRRATVQGIPWPLVFLAAFAALEIVPIFVKYATSTNRMTPIATVIAVSALLVPLSLKTLFWTGRRKLDEMTTRGYWMLAGLAIILSLICLTAAARLL